MSSTLTRNFRTHIAVLRDIMMREAAAELKPFLLPASSRFSTTAFAGVAMILA